MAFTYFFRDWHTLDLAAKYVVPYAAGRSNIRVWDAGCAAGQEPYTLAIAFAEIMGQYSFRNLHIEATDIDGSNLFGEIIEKGEYPEVELQRIPEQLFKKYFHPGSTPGVCRIDKAIQKRLHFQKHDLLSMAPVGEEFSLIVCKNVLLHFQMEERIAVIKMFHKTLAPGGFFATEQTQKMPDELLLLFEQITADAQLFKKIG